MKLGYAILYVDDVEASMTAWEAAFGLPRRFLHVTRAMFDGGPARFEVGLVTDDVPAAWERALSHGMIAVVPPDEKPWGQTVAWVRDAQGFLIELATPMG
jgi:lactoylglutathione lyase